MLSRNFRLQRVGDIRWLQQNYDFSKISFSIDELIVLDVTRQKKNHEKFCQAIHQLAKNCFLPISAGGGVCDIDVAKKLLRAGADKVVINTAIRNIPGCVALMAQELGEQCLVASVDIRRKNGKFSAFNGCGEFELPDSAEQYLSEISDLPMGELYLNSIDRDGTGQGLDIGLLDILPGGLSQPVILAGGVGNASHIDVGLKDPRVDAVATANLFNFVGDGLIRAREKLILEGHRMASWDLSYLRELNN